MQEPPPPAFICQITQDVMDDPVVTIDGHSYGRSAITTWLQDNDTSPATGDRLRRTTLVPNIALRHAIDQWRARQPMAIDPARVKLTDEVLGEGQGGFGRVVGGLLTTHGLEHQVAVKMLPALTHAEQRVQFEKELKVHITAMEGADGVCRLLGTCEKIHHGRRQLCLVMKRYDRSLADRIRDGPLSTNEIRRIGHVLCRSLDQLHRARVVVRDIKPQNILLDQHDSPVFADFGISAIHTSTAHNTTCIKGTFNYMAPEQFEEAFGKEVDLWAMACVLVEMDTGVAPWHDKQMAQIMRAVADHKQTPPVRDSVPAFETV